MAIHGAIELHPLRPTHQTAPAPATSPLTCSTKSDTVTTASRISCSPRHSQAFTSGHRIRQSQDFSLFYNG
jgi:hypothetical protein